MLPVSLAHSLPPYHHPCILPCPHNQVQVKVCGPFSCRPCRGKNTHLHCLRSFPWHHQDWHHHQKGTCMQVYTTCGLLAHTLFAAHHCMLPIPRSKHNRRTWPPFLPVWALQLPQPQRHASRLSHAYFYQSHSCPATSASSCLDGSPPLPPPPFVACTGFLIIIGVITTKEECSCLPSYKWSTLSIPPQLFTRSAKRQPPSYAQQYAQRFD